MKRVAYETVALQVEKLYDFSIVEERKIEERCELIREFIESCGWEIGEFLTYEAPRN